MSRLRTVSGNRFEDILRVAPGALEADTEMYRQIKMGITQRLYSLIGVTLSYTEKGTLDEGSVRHRDVDALRRAGLSDTDILTVATAIAYYNYAFRVAAAFDVIPRQEMS